MRRNTSFPRCLLLAATSVVLASCSSSAIPSVTPVPGLEAPRGGAALSAWYIRQSDSLSRLDPVADATAAGAAGRCRLLGVFGYALMVPGYPERPDRYPHGIYAFPATSDAIRSDGQIEYTEAAFNYAARYNPALLNTSCQTQPVPATPE